MRLWIIKNKNKNAWMDRRQGKAKEELTGGRERETETETERN